MLPKNSQLIKKSILFNCGLSEKEFFIKKQDNGDVLMVKKLEETVIEIAYKSDESNKNNKSKI